MTRGKWGWRKFLFHYYSRAYPNFEMFAPEPFRALRDWHTALTTLRQRLYIEPDTDADARLQQAMHELLAETPDGYVMRGLGPGRLALISWRPR